MEYSYRIVYFFLQNTGRHKLKLYKVTSAIIFLLIVDSPTGVFWCFYFVWIVKLRNYFLWCVTWIVTISTWFWGASTLEDLSRFKYAICNMEPLVFHDFAIFKHSFAQEQVIEKNIFLAYFRDKWSVVRYFCVRETCQALRIVPQKKYFKEKNSEKLQSTL